MYLKTESSNREGESQRDRCLKQINRPKNGGKDVYSFI